MANYGTYTRRRKPNKTSKLIFAILAVASLVLVFYMFIEYTASLTAKNDINDDFADLNARTTYLQSQKQEKNVELENLQAEFAALEAEYASYQD